jgi:alpha-glucosidase (family GH31 glycosyl hydrolase)
VWPGPCAFPDFTIERVRTWWAGLIAEYSAKGVDGIWNDMNEPAVFKVSHTRRIVISQQLFTSRIIYAIHRPYPQSRFLAIASVDFVWRCQ